MTIGIAASGPGAGRAILEALAKAELVASGALGGFVSFACLTDAGVLRASVQRKGATGLLADGLPAGCADARLAVLMSSGPDRPEPLAQFTPADPAAGLVTGHRFPNVPGRDGVSPGEAALRLLRQGLGPSEAANRVATDYPTADAGVICLSRDGEIGLANSAYVAGFRGLGAASRERDGRRTGVLCNGISQADSVAALVAEIVLDATAPKTKELSVKLHSGLRVARAARAELQLTPDLVPSKLLLPTFDGSSQEWLGGYGPAACVTIGGRLIGVLIDEPFMVGRGNTVSSFDGSKWTTVRVHPF